MYIYSQLALSFCSDYRDMNLRCMVFSSECFILSYGMGVASATQYVYSIQWDINYWQHEMQALLLTVKVCITITYLRGHQSSAHCSVPSIYCSIDPRQSIRQCLHHCVASLTDTGVIQLSCTWQPVMAREFYLAVLGTEQVAIWVDAACTLIREIDPAEQLLSISACIDY